jgi:hypothetical protein
LTGKKEMGFRGDLVTDLKIGFENLNGFLKWNAGYPGEKNRMRLLTAF